VQPFSTKNEKDDFQKVIIFSNGAFFVEANKAQPPSNSLAGQTS
jgi:hypothetical protein